MDYKVKYLKYKEKYLFIKNLKGGSINKNAKIRTQYNSGRREGMTNQCLWISIHDHLLKRGLTMTLRQLRQDAGLDATTEHTMFDSTDALFRRAINRICIKYGLSIQFFPIDSNGDLLYNGNIIDLIGNGRDKVSIAQFGIDHFQRIKKADEPDESESDPESDHEDLLAFFDDTSYIFKDLSYEAQQAYLSLTQLTNQLYILEKEQMDLEQLYYKIEQEKDALIQSKEPNQLIKNYELRQKAIVKNYKTMKINKNIKAIEDIKNKLRDLIKLKK
jgi:hypothetical protein